MSSFRERNDRKGPKGPSVDRQRGHVGPQKRSEPRPRSGGDPDQWIWGWHAVAAALVNPDRPEPRRVLATPDRARQVGELSRPGRDRLDVEIVEPGELSRLLPSGASHQGVAVHTPALEPADLFVFEAEPHGVLVMLDQVTDPQNVGAILRSAAAFGARGVILQDRRAPPLAGALAKAAAGALETTPCVQVTNLSRTLDQLKAAGWRAVGLAGEAPDALADVLDETPTVLVLGSEGEGLRRLVSESCDRLAQIPMPGGFESLNVASAAAVALYAAGLKKH